MHRRFTLVLLGAALVASSTNVYSDRHYVVNNGVTCQVMNTTQQRWLEWKATALVNKSLSVDVWVSCPFISVRHSSANPVYHYVGVSMSNNGSEVKSATCFYREVGVDGVVATTLSDSEILAGFGGTTTLAMFNPEVEPDQFGAATVACLLPRNTQLNRVYQYIDN